MVSNSFKRILFNVLYEYLQPITSPSQFGFPKERSRIIWRVIYMEILYNANGCVGHINVIYTDYERESSIKWTLGYSYKNYTKLVSDAC